MVRPTWESFEATVAAMTDQLVTVNRLSQDLGSQAVELVCEREFVASTSQVDIGVSIPHARVDGIDGIIAALAVSPGAVYHVADGLPISIVSLVLTSPRLTTEHLEFLSSLSTLLQSPEVRENLRNAATVEAVLGVLGD